MASDFDMASYADDLDADSANDLLYEGLDSSEPDSDLDEEAPDAPEAAVADIAGPEPTTQPAIVITTGLRKEFISGGEIIRAVDDVDLTLTTRQLVTITGPSGCGKTTLLYLLGSLEKPTAGSLVIDGVDVGALSGRDADQFRRHKIGFVFQSYQLIPNLTALENVMLPMELAGAPRASRRDRAIHLLQQVGIEEKRFQHHPNKLSGGQQQRVAIARALANDPSVILADEPTGNLDSNNSRRLVNLLRALAQEGRTIVIVTHDRGIARLADLRIDLVDGRVARMITSTPGERAAAEQERKQNARREGSRQKRRRS